MTTITREDAFVAIRDLTEAKLTTMSMRRLAKSIAARFDDLSTDMPQRASGYPIAYYVGVGMTDDNGVPLRWHQSHPDGSRKGEPIVEDMTGDVICGACASKEGDAWHGHEVLVSEILMVEPGEYGLRCDHCGTWIEEPEEVNATALAVSGGEHEEGILDIRRRRINTIREMLTDDEIIGALLDIQERMENIWMAVMNPQDGAKPVDDRAAYRQIMAVIMGDDGHYGEAEETVPPYEYDRHGHVEDPVDFEREAMNEPEPPEFGVAIWYITDGNDGAYVIRTIPAENPMHALASRDRIRKAFADNGVSGPDGPFADAVEIGNMWDTGTIEDITEGAITSIPHYDVHASFGASLPDTSLRGYFGIENARYAAKDLAETYYGENTFVVDVDENTWSAKPSGSSYGGTTVYVTACDDPECLADEDGIFRY